MKKLFKVLDNVKSFLPHIKSAIDAFEHYEQKLRSLLPKKELNDGNP